MRVAIVGAGALGCAIGATLTEGGLETWLVRRSAEQVAQLQQHGLRVDDTAGSRIVDVRATTQPAEIGAVDVVIVVVKSFHTEAAIRGSEPLIGENTVVVSMQNGLGQEDVIAGVIGRERVLAGRTYVGGVMVGLGHIRSGVAGRLSYLGELDQPVTPRVRALAHTLTAAGLTTIACDDMIATCWDKLLVNVATGALAGITGLTYGQFYDEPRVVATASAAVAEAIAVAHATGVRLSMTDPAAVLRLAADGLGPDFKTSMLQSLERGTRTEIDAVNGAVVRAGRAANIPTPVNDTLVACVTGIERAMIDRQMAARHLADRSEVVL